MLKLVEQEYYRKHISPMYDLDYDIQLKAAVDILKKEDVPALLRTTKTVKELQDAAAATVASSGKNGAQTAGADGEVAPSDGSGKVLVPDPLQ